MSVCGRDTLPHGVLAKFKQPAARARFQQPPASCARSAKVAGVNMADFVTIDDDGQPHIDLSGVRRRQFAAVNTVEGPIVEEGHVMKAPKIRMHDKLKAVDMLAKMAKLYGTRPCTKSTSQAWSPSGRAGAARAQGPSE